MYFMGSFFSNSDKLSTQSDMNVPVKIKKNYLGNVSMQLFNVRSFK